MKRLIIIPLLLLGLLAYGETYYLSPTGNDATGNGSIGSPWFTMNKGITAMSAGDTLYLRAGTYTYTSQQEMAGMTGTSGNMFNIWAYPSEVPVITSDAEYSTANGTSLIDFESTAVYVYFKGVKIYNHYQRESPTALWHGLLVRSANCIYENIDISRCGNGVYLGTVATGNLFLNCDSHHNYDPYTSGDAYGDADGFGVTTNEGTANEFKNCRSYRNSDDGFDAYNTNGYVKFDGCWSFHNGYREDGTTTGGNGVGFKLGESGDYSALNLRDVYNNLSFRNRGTGIQQTAAQTIIEFYNNTVYANGNHGLEIYSYALAHVVKNNVSFGNTNNNYNDDGGASIANCIIGNNSYDADWQSGGPVATSADFVSVDSTGVSGARQTDGSLPLITFLHLVVGSDLKDAGAQVGVTTDADGETRGYLPDIGAYEYEDIRMATTSGSMILNESKIVTIRR